jgi:hypothetical protein
MVLLYFVKLASGTELQLYASSKADAILSANELVPSDRVVLVCLQDQW